MWIFEKLRDEMPRFWEADSQALIHMRRGAYGSEPPLGIAAGATLAVLIPYAALLASFVVGLAYLPRDRLAGLLLAFLVFSNALHVATHGYARYRLPVLPVLFVLAAWAWTRGHDAGEAPPIARARALAAVAAAILVLSLLPSVRLLFRPGALVSENARFGIAGPSEAAGAGGADEGAER